MKSRTEGLLVCLSVLTFAICGVRPLQAQNAASNHAAATARIVVPISITPNHDMDFGGLIPDPNQSGTVLFNLSPGGTPIAVNDPNTIPMVPVNGGPGTITPFNTPQVHSSPQLAVFTVQGEKNMAFNIIVPAPTDPIPVTLQGVTTAGAASMILDNFQCVVGTRVGINPPPPSGNIGLTGALTAGNGFTPWHQYFALGATLHVGPANGPSKQLPGNYSGSYHVNVNYY